MTLVPKTSIIPSDPQLEAMIASNREAILRHSLAQSGPESSHENLSGSGYGDGPTFGDFPP